MHALIFMGIGMLITITGGACCLLIASAKLDAQAEKERESE